MNANEKPELIKSVEEFKTRVEKIQARAEEALNRGDNEEYVRLDEELAKLLKEYTEE